MVKAIKKTAEKKGRNPSGKNKESKVIKLIQLAKQKLKELKR
ncbi:MAG: hypothetical protein Q8O03_00460 [Nanoarchaeota archaeon]|jgi:hypothetical protein|nr:hypothetical protein [Nanoarchaeota archaeon]